MKNIFIFFKGVAMGTADVIPGVSGGTIAFITGIYDTLLTSVSRLNITALQYLFKGRFREFWSYINGSFLLVLAAGMFTAIGSLAKLFSYLLVHYPLFIWAFFFGLIAASVWFMSKQLKGMNVTAALFLLLGIGLTLYISLAEPVSGPDHLGYIFLCGAIAICAMILPGISGSFILLLMGAYPIVLQAVTDLNVVLLGVFMGGAVLGLLSFSRVVKFALEHYRLWMLSFLTGLLAGSLFKVWPWKTISTWRINSKGVKVSYLEKNVWPGDYALVSPAEIELGITVKDPSVWMVLGLMVAGAILVLILSRFSPDTTSTDSGQV